jgi:hypothetical protein
MIKPKQQEKYPFGGPELTVLKEKREIQEKKAVELREQLAAVKDKITALDKAIFDLEDGRLLKVIKGLMAEDSELSKHVEALLLSHEIGSSTSHPGQAEKIEARKKAKEATMAAAEAAFAKSQAAGAAKTKTQ